MTRGPKLGIGIITFNRRDLLAETVERVRALTRQPDTRLLVADDGSTDGTADLMRQRGVAVVTGANMGVAWNKNRALFLLHHVFACETVLLLEDDAQPAVDGWEADWLRATTLWHHVNYVAPWMKWGLVAGSGTPEDPILSWGLTAQCCTWSRDALTWGGYFDTRFRGFGIGHVEHTHRLHRVGYGGRMVRYQDQDILLSQAIHGGITVRDAGSAFNQEQRDRNWEVYRAIHGQEGYRAPWRTDAEMRQFRSEIEMALQAGEAAFALRPGT
ncbi:MAG: glycosyltransferase [Acetobacteraceae bacterium]